jgi:hypothetical protein
MKNDTEGDPTVTIHGNPWKITHIQEEVRACFAGSWQRETWKPSPALIDKTGGSVRTYHGQKFDPKHFDLVDNGWTHDHCSICWWSLHESDDPEVGVGYRTQSGHWLCSECYGRFIRDNELALNEEANQGRQATASPSPAT